MAKRYYIEKETIETIRATRTLEVDEQYIEDLNIYLNEHYQIIDSDEDIKVTIEDVVKLFDDGSYELPEIKIKEKRYPYFSSLWVTVEELINEDLWDCDEEVNDSEIEEDNNSVYTFEAGH